MTHRKNYTDTAYTRLKNFVMLFLKKEQLFFFFLFSFFSLSIPPAMLRLRPTIRSLSRNFHRSCINLDAVVVSGTKLANTIRANVAEKVINYNKEHFGDNNKSFENFRFQPSLTILQVGSRPDSSAYVKSKLKAAASSNIKSKLIKLDESISQEDLVEVIERLNKDPKVHGILVQLPLPKHIDESVITNSVATDKDVDGFDHYNVGQLSKRGGTPYFKPCTPNGIMELIKTTGIPLRGKTAVVIGRSDIVGTPVATMLRNEDCTVTVCHRYTQNLPEIVRQADIVVAAVGIAEYVKADWVKDGAIVIDVGINYKDDPTCKKRKTFGGGR